MYITYCHNEHTHTHKDFPPDFRTKSKPHLNGARFLWIMKHYRPTSQLTVKFTQQKIQYVSLKCALLKGLKVKFNNTGLLNSLYRVQEGVEECRRRERRPITHNKSRIRLVLK